MGGSQSRSSHLGPRGKLHVKDVCRSGQACPPACLWIIMGENHHLHFHRKPSSFGDSLLQQLSLYPACFITGLLRTDPLSLPANSQMLQTWGHDFFAPSQSSLLWALYQPGFQFLAGRCRSKFLPLESAGLLCFITLPRFSSRN